MEFELRLMMDFSVTGMYFYWHDDTNEWLPYPGTKYPNFASASAASDWVDLPDGYNRYSVEICEVA